MLHVENLTASIGDKQILRGLDLDVGDGEVHAIMGPNGSGKSTFAHALAGREGYEIGGTVTLDGANLLFSADAWASIGSTVAAPADVLRWNGASVSTAWAASAMSIPPGADLIALERLGNGHLVVGFDVA